MTELIQHIVETLSHQDHVVIKQAIPEDLCHALLAEAMTASYTPAKIGRGTGQQYEESIRSDSTCWLSGKTEAQKQYLNLIEALRLALNQRFFLGLQDYEAHFARYNKGEFYRQHFDSFRGNNPRRISTVLYLNPDWRPDMGGALCIHHERDPVLQVWPDAGTLVIFVSENTPHEVLPALQTRYSLSGWLRVSQSR